MIVDEWIDGDGRLQRSRLASGGDCLWLIEGDVRRPLPANAIAVVMRRYGRELEAGVVATGERLGVGELGALQRLRFRAAVDADGRDYLVWTEPGRAPLAALSRDVAAALRHLAANLPGR